MMRALFLVVAAAMMLPGGRPLTARDVDGHSWVLLAPESRQLDLLFFVSTDCPISNRYVPEIKRICGEYEARGVRCFAVYLESDVALVKQHQQDFGQASIPAILDADRSLVRATGATTTPEAVLYSSAGWLYRGRIDDLYIDVGRSRRTPTRHDVRLALDAALGGRSVSPVETEPVGCLIQRP
jgi:hypothetical protein